MKRLLCVVLLLLVLAVPPAGAAPAPVPTAPLATTITQWTFESPPTPPTPPTPAIGTGTASGGSGLTGESYPTGNGSSSGWSFTGWTTATSLDATDYLQFAVPTTGYQNITFGFGERRSATGIRAFEIHYSTDGTNFQIVPGSTTSVPDDTSWRTHLYDLSALTGMNNNANAAFRIYGYSAEAGAGTWRIDDVTINGDALTDLAPTVASTIPANNATGVSPSASVSVTFSEAVTFSGTVDITCTSGAPRTVTPAVTADPKIWNLPHAVFTAGDVCSITIPAAQVVDQDGTANSMVAPYTWSFTVSDCTDTSGLTKISYVQGNGLTSSYQGSIFTIEGIVVGDYETGGMQGYFVEEEDLNWDTDPATSEGIFVRDANATSEVSLGDKVRVTGKVAETYSRTELETITSLAVCSSGQGSLVTVTSVSLPATSSTYLERYEGMWVTFPQELTVTDNYDLARYGELTLSQDGKLWQFTHQNAPNAINYAAYLNEITLRSILLDDGSTTQNLDPIFYPGTGLTAANTVRVDDTITDLTGVLDYNYGVYRLQPIGQVNFTAVARPTTPPAVGGSVKVGAFNTLNFFVTTGAANTCGPDGTLACRGATNSAEFTRQRDKLVAAICGLNADVLGLMELENPRSTATTDPVLGNLVTALNASSACVDDYAFIDNAWAGTDAIRQGIIYKPTVVTPVGATAILATTAFINGGDGSARNRPALTQAFEVVDTGERFIVAVNHLKSKGSACDAPDTLDGQANCAIVRTNAASALATWLVTDPTGTGDPDILIMGDLNSYAQEDPITTLVGAGFGYTDLINHFVVNNSERYGYAFDGMMGYLDHALASPTLLAQATGAGEWHINSPEPDVLDYNTEYKSAGQVTSLYNADPYRSTDHDPVIVGLNLAGNNDLSDLPASYGAAWHTFSELQLGDTWAAGHSTVGGSTNDGVAPTTGVVWSIASGGSVDVTVTGGAGYVTGWIDWNRDGDFLDSFEQVFTNEEFPTPQSRTIGFTIPAGTTFDDAFNARFRLYPDLQIPDTLVAGPSGIDAAPSPSGGAIGGEVEDYTWALSPNAVTLSSLAATDVSRAAWPAAAGLGVLGIVLLARRRRK